MINRIFTVRQLQIEKVILEGKKGFVIVHVAEKVILELEGQ